MREYKLFETSDIDEKILNLKDKLIKCISEQSHIWHRTSHKKVAAGIYLSERNDYIIAQNVGLSLVTGSLCAERAVIATAVAKYPDLRYDEITSIMTIGEKNPLLPCGVCCEWLFKINTDMVLYTVKDDRILEIKLEDYYGDETTI